MKANELSGDTKKKVTGNVTDDLDNYMQEEFKRRLQGDISRCCDVIFP